MAGRCRLAKAAVQRKGSRQTECPIAAATRRGIKDTSKPGTKTSLQAMQTRGRHSRRESRTLLQGRPASIRVLRIGPIGHRPSRSGSGSNGPTARPIPPGTFLISRGPLRSIDLQVAAWLVATEAMTTAIARSRASTHFADLMTKDTDKVDARPMSTCPERSSAGWWQPTRLPELPCRRKRS